MARFDIFLNEGRSKKTTPYLIDIQSNVISALATRIVIPLRTLTAFGALTVPKDLCPTITVLGEKVFLDTPQIAAIPANELKNRVGTADVYQAEILAAMDRVFGAF